MRRLVTALVVLLLWVPAQSASASQIISTSSAAHVTLGVNAKGEAMVSYVQGGRTVHVLAWGAMNAVSPSPTGTQVSFGLGYDGGFRHDYTDNPIVRSTLRQLRDLQQQTRTELSAGDQSAASVAFEIEVDYAKLATLRAQADEYWRTFTCPSYHGPPLADLVAACTAPDGSYWAIQSWDRDLPDYGLSPTKAQSQMEIHLSHWKGPLPVLTVHVDWGWGGQWNHLWGTYTYQGQGVYGFRSTPQGVPLDSFGRNVYVDTFDSAYGPGWHRENSFLTHSPGGSWCYSVNPHGVRPAGTGSQYRITILGPGVTPDVSLTVNAPGPYNAAAQAPDDAALLALHDPACVPHV